MSWFYSKRLSNGDIGDATDESTTYDVEEEEIVGTVSIFVKIC